MATFVKSLTFPLLNKLRFSLSNANAWNENDGCFNYVTFYNNIVDFFEIAPGPAARLHIQELLAWWTRYAMYFSVDQDF